jgi:uncharacterized SAM-binding protein YcdF (DUF218 family)
MSENTSESLTSPETQQPLFDVVVVLGGNIRKTKSGRWVTTSYTEGKEKAIGAHARMIAAAQLYKEGKAKKFIVSTGQSVLIEGESEIDKSSPTEAEIMKKEMVRLGIPDEDIILEDKSDSTLANTKESAKIIRAMDFKRIGLLTSFWHLERAMVMFEAQRLDIEGRSIIPLSADDIVAAKSRRHKMVVDEMENSPTIKKRLESETEGIKAFKDGAYKVQPDDWSLTKDEG